MLSACRQVNELEAHISEQQIQLSKVENWNYALQAQLDEAKGTIQTAEDKITELARDKKDLAKAKSSAVNASEKSHKEQVRTLQAEIERIKEEWSSPQSVQGHLDTIQQLQANNK